MKNSPNKFISKNTLKNASSLDELITNIESFKGELEYSNGKPINKSELVKQMRDYQEVAGKTDLKYITSNYGLRAKFEELALKDLTTCRKYPKSR